MLTLNNIFASGADFSQDQDSQWRSKVIATPKFLWPHFKKSRSHSPKDDYNFRLVKIPDSKVERLQKLSAKLMADKKAKILQNTSKPSINDSKIRKSNEMVQISDITMKILDEKSRSFEEIEENIAANNGDSFLTKETILKEDLVEEHPLYAISLPKIMSKSFRKDVAVNLKRSKSPLTVKQITKENQIKLFHLNKLLEQSDFLPNHKNALICSKILEILEENPELFVEIPDFFSKFLRKFLFCMEENIYGMFSNLKYGHILKKPQTYLALVETLFEEIQVIKNHNQYLIDLKQQQIEGFSEKNRKLEEEISNLNAIIKEFNDNSMAQREAFEKQFKEQVKIYFYFFFLFY